MAKIHVLPEVLAHQIAAGEIVERPASVVKELLENALDARAASISVEASDGGKKRLVVRDDGTGMSEEDARLAFQRHATSKISSMEDLDAVGTLGFRGEALPTIASVSRLRLRTVEEERAEQQPLGTEIEYEGGKLVEVREVAWPSGTEVIVEDLFFNVPARRKFLKTTSTELGHVSRQVHYYALACPEVEFRFRHNDRLIFEAPGVASLRERVFQVLGEKFLSNLTAVDFEKSGVRVHGFTSLPHEQKSNTQSQYLYVNRRMVRDKVLMHAIRQAYRDLIPSSAHPTMILFVETDPALLDVNVHPAKTEIRFRNSREVHSAVFHAIEEALLKHRTDLGSLARDVPADQLRQEGGDPSQDRRHGVARSIEGFFHRQTASSPLFQSGPPFGYGRQGPSYPHGYPSPGGAGRQAPAHSGQEAREPYQRGSPVEEHGDTYYARPEPGRRSADPHADNIPETTHISSAPVVLGQFVESFIIAADRDGVLLIDQHVAHERILYDRALRQMQSGQDIPVQRLLVPITIDLTPQQKVVMDDILDELQGNGFEVDWFGEETIVVKGLPQVAKNCDVEDLIEGVLDDLPAGTREKDSSGQAVQRLREEIAISLSCRAAIKINTPLSKDKMQWFLDELFACENPYTCPHGRPIVLRMSVEDVLRGFHRI
ncbi:MAG TPA: DNA mismatch repair endonuclease MutL [Acidobacteriota bacterium]|nr:DNA mismatch repair endonuclease MutL [Acidobacteriota bacterium]